MNPKDYKEIAGIIKTYFDNVIRRLSRVDQEDAIFPLAGQEFRNNVIPIINVFRNELANKYADLFERDDKIQFKEKAEQSRFTEEEPGYNFNKQQFLKDCGLK